ncbi:helix-turn-helix domain-containing protein [Mucilaginibacter ginsenosidivorans]|uniref:Helix-turn-helix transcriptional regulator n=1 Tax=Mucilaginibacter ginsenosidivorans TaxID=398053 RepID=A0A5B8UUC5_9SPHI|nr:helix-turn-helix transcriptional regulator [Mucilaginibacter ginsenosidivorans]QEC62488.1 helix-turn-helix transcriptional regulator [Mucilaginibacter ginsenosidivorans]
MHTIGERIRLLRLERGWNQEFLASLLRVSVPALSKMETGITDLNLSRLDQLAEVFGLSMAGLMSRNSGREGELGEEETLRRLLEQRDVELLALQKKVIGLLEELREAVEG